MASSERRACWGALLGAALIALAPDAGAQQPPPPLPVRAPPSGQAPVTASPSPAPAGPVTEPPYDPAQHHGMSEAVWLRATRGTARRSTGMMITGMLGITLAASLMAGGTGIYLGDNNCQGLNNACNGGRATGMAVFSSGLIALGLSLPLTIYGATDVPRAESGSALRGGERPSLGVALGARGATLALRF